ncbi:PREDICTED: small integral membrane protein 8 [Polistes dominula]|uniref:Small integral membrane protein 8 n=1 Tax=Polistes dominula TaxID=743375 RepID=A0ABM1IJH4_POLDO|nr:PREDICTED: small integral membrane protein 8 [Polistes dominula]
MKDKTKESAPGDGIRSLRSTALFRAVNYELYVKPNRGIMLFGVMAMLTCSGYLFYMRYKHDGTDYYESVQADGNITLKNKTSKWLD